MRKWWWGTTCDGIWHLRFTSRGSACENEPHLGDPGLRKRPAAVALMDIIKPIGFARSGKKEEILASKLAVLAGAVILLLFGPSQLPKMARGLGEALREFKKAQREIRDEVHGDETPSKPADPKPSS